MKLRWLFLAAGCGIFIYLLSQVDIPEVLGLLAEVGWGLGLVAAAYAVHQLIRTIALWRCAAIHVGVPYWALVRIRLSGEAVQHLTFTGPFLAEPTKAMFLRRHGLNAAQAFAATVSEYLIYTFTSALMAVIVLSYMLGNYSMPRPLAIGSEIAAWVAGVFLVVSAIAILARVYLIGAILNGVVRVPWIGRRLKLNKEKLRETEDWLFVILREQPSSFFTILGIELIAQIPLLFELYVLLSFAQLPFEFVDPLLIEASTKFLSMVFFFIPAQVGASEGIYTLVFETLGLSATAGFTLALARRLRTLLVAGVGLALLGIDGKTKT